jgi:hypothetical protein
MATSFGVSLFHRQVILGEMGDATTACHESLYLYRKAGDFENKYVCGIDKGGSVDVIIENSASEAVCLSVRAEISCALRPIDPHPSQAGNCWR